MTLLEDLLIGLVMMVCLCHNHMCCMSNYSFAAVHGIVALLEFVQFESCLQPCDVL